MLAYREDWRLHRNQNTKGKDKPGFWVKKSFFQLTKGKLCLVSTFTISGHPY